jgi:NAD(P)-dependent dehydrogenase (short-subunit alcohol dehydrogenase family)
MNQPAQQQRPPGRTGEMNPRPDHGEDSYQGSGRLAGKAAVITGGDSGIGRAVAIAFAREGADVLIAYLSEHKDAEETRKWIEQAGRKAVLVAGDLSDPARCRAVIDAAVAAFGRVDVLVSNAAQQRTHDKLEDISDEEWDQTLAVNLSAFFYLTKAALPHMGPGSSIIGTTSVNSDSPTPDAAALRRHQGRHREHDSRARSAPSAARHPREQRRSRPDLDTADPVDHARRACGEVRIVVRTGPARAARRGRTGIRPAGLGRGQLHLGRTDRRHRRQADPVGHTTALQPPGFVSAAAGRSATVPGNGASHLLGRNFTARPPTAAGSPTCFVRWGSGAGRAGARGSARTRVGLDGQLFL